MKNFAILLSLLFITTLGWSQGSILGFTMNPANPTSTDTIYIYADLQFNYSDCQLDQSSHSVSGQTIQADAHHCVGLLAAICYPTDTFKINPLPAGQYSFNLSITSGTAPAPCTPGIAIDHDSTIQFSVEPNTAWLKPENPQSAFDIYPNPAKESITISTTTAITETAAIAIYDLNGRLITETPFQTNIQPDLVAGIYFVSIKDKNQIIGTRKLMILP